MGGSESLEIYDAYLLDSIGTPLMVGCTRTNYCLNHLDKHPLHTGFLSAINAFIEEVFSDKPIIMQLDQILIKFKSDSDNILVTIHPKEIELEKADEVIDKMWELFQSKYKHRIEGSWSVTDELFNEWMNDFKKLEIIPINATLYDKTGDQQIIKVKESQETKPSKLSFKDKVLRFSRLFRRQ